jgi:hypothetical protein
MEYAQHFRKRQSHQDIQSLKEITKKNIKYIVYIWPLHPNLLVVSAYLNSIYLIQIKFDFFHQDSYIEVDPGRCPN